MFLSQLVALVWRRRLVALIGLVMTLGLCVLTAAAVTPLYSVTARMVLLPPVAKEAGANPYLSLGGLTPPAEVLAQTMSGPTVVTELRSAGVETSYTVVRDYATSAPIIVVTAEGDSPAEARRTRDAVVDRVPTTLASIQAEAEVPPSAQLTVALVSTEEEYTVSFKPLIRAILVVLAGGLALTVAIAALVDAIVRSRRGRRAGDPAHVAQAREPHSRPEPEPEGEPTSQLPNGPAGKGRRKGGPEARSETVAVTENAG